MNSPRWPWFSGLFLCFAATAAAAAASFDATKLREIPARMQAFVDAREMAGAVTLVATADKVVALDAVGFSDLATRRALRRDDLFWIASMTKPLAAVCVLMLQDAGKLSVEDAVEKHLPEFKGQWLLVEKSATRRALAPAPRPVTIRDLLTHTSGLGDVAAPRAHSTLGELVSAYAREPLQFPPGSKWAYCNSGINTLGRIVEVVSGMKYEEFQQRRLLTPLGMRDTTFWPTPAQARRVAVSYKKNAAGELEVVENFFLKGALSDRHRTPYPAGGLYSTAADMAKLYQMLLRGGGAGGRRLLSEAAARQLTTTQTGPEITTGFVNGMSWGFGFQVVQEPKGVTEMLSAGTFGHGGAYATQSWADPARGLVLVLMFQRAGLPNGDASEMRREFQAAAVGAWGR